MVAGAAAILKAARPNLTAAQYRSLLVNASSVFSPDLPGPAPVQQAGAGLLNVASSLRSTIAAVPHSFSFGAGAGTIDSTRILTLSNLGTTDDTFWIAGEPLGGGPAPALSESAVSLAPGESKSVQVRLAASEMPAGQYQGFLIVRSSISDAAARIPWWYGVPSDQVAALTTGRIPEDGSPSSSETFYVRPTDVSGLAVDVLPEVSVTTGDGQVEDVSKSRVFPGFFAVRVRLGPAPGANTFSISAKGVTTTVTIPAH
jgi:hypothetical protein